MNEKFLNLPEELLPLKRFIKVRDDEKTPHGKGWQKAENQKNLSEITTINAAFFIKGEPNYLILDLDHVLDDDKKFKNSAAQDFYNNFRAVFPNAYCEKSCSGQGLHIIFKPTAGIFKTIHNEFSFDAENNSKCEVFFDFNKTVTLTGNIFDCEPKSEIPNGEVADEFIVELLKKVEIQSTKQNKKFRHSFDKNFLHSDEYETARALAMLDAIDFSQLTYIEWLSVMTSCKNLSIDYSIVDAKNAQDSERYNAKKNLETWQAINDGSIGIANLHSKAKRFGFDNKKFFRDWKENHSDETRNNRSQKNDFDDETNKAVTTKDVISDCPIDLVLPSGFKFNANGIMRYVTKLERYVFCCYTPVVVTKKFILQSSKLQYEIAFLNHKNKWQFVTVDADVISDNRKIIQLSNYGIGITSTDAKYLSAFLVELINLPENKFKIPTERIFSKIGWQDSACKNFIYPTGGKIDGEPYNVKRPCYNYPEIFAEKGDRQKWLEKYQAVLILNAKVKLILGAALVAPLIKPLNLLNIWIHIHGKSNNGKTVIGKAAVSVFGSPSIKDGLLRTLDASKANFQSVLVGLNCFPIVYDELESLPKKAKEDLLNWIYNFTGGITGQRNKRNGEERESETFSGVLFTTGEQPLLTENSKRGAFKRTLEIKLDKIASDQTMRTWHIFFENNFGHFGKEWIRYISENLSDLKAEFDSELNKLFSTDSELNKFDATNIKTVFACHFTLKKFCEVILKEHLAKEMLIILKETFSSDWQEILSMLPTIDRIDDSSRALEALRDFVNSHSKSFVREASNENLAKGIEEYDAESYVSYGKIFNNGDVAFFPTVASDILEKQIGFPNGRKILDELKETERLEYTRNRITKVIKIAGTSKRVVYIRGLLDETTYD